MSYTIEMRMEFDVQGRSLAKGLPEWYKEQLFAKVFGEAEA